MSIAKITYDCLKIEKSKLKVETRNHSKKRGETEKPYE